MSKKVSATPFFENALREAGLLYVAGLDEAGCGPLAGPVTAACVLMPETVIPGIEDSKRLSAVKRGLLAQEIRQAALAYGVGWASAEEVDRINIRNAARLAMERAVEECLKIHPLDFIIVDYTSGLSVPVGYKALPKADAHCYSVAAASILAKTSRDAYMLEMHEQYPQYGFQKNMGYGTEAHYAALERWGITELHRQTFLKKWKARG